jgi:hypothetical protein
MKALVTGSAIAFALSVSVAAQDSTVKSQTKVSGNDTHVVTMQGCLQRPLGTSGFLLMGGITAAGKDLKSKSTVKTDVDDNDTNVKSKSATKIDHDDHGVATSGTVTAYTVTARDGVDLAAHAGEEVEISAVMIDAKRGGDKDADLKIKDKTKVEREDAPDTKVQSTTKADVPRAASAQLMAMSVKSLGRTCSRF